MATSRPSSRAASAARAQVIDALIDDHKRVKKAYRDFKKLDPQEDAERCQQLVNQVLMELQVHTALEEELLYPAIREAVNDTDMLDEAEVEHESAHTLIDQLQLMTPEDDKYIARFTVLCEYVLHHVKEEEGELFPSLEKARMDWQTIAGEIETRREELMAVHAPAEEEEEMEEAVAAPAAARKRTSRSR
jgi:iron-sulfur cluster repair protein YtfE (RIC family)